MTALFDTPRLSVRMPDPGDAPFMLDILNTPGWLRFIGDRRVRTLDDARAYITDVYLKAHADQGYGAYVVTLRDTGLPIGVCGLFKRPYLPTPDLGYALLPAYEGQGYAREAASGVINHVTREAASAVINHVTGKATSGVIGYVARADLKAIVSETNARSINLLEKLGFTFQERLRPPGEDREILVYRL